MQQNDFKQFIQARVVIGSRAYGLHTPTSDKDIRGWYAAPAESFFQLSQDPPEQLEFSVEGRPEDKDVFWELRKYLNMLLKANPTVLETLYTPIVEQTSEYHSMLIANRYRFISKRAYDTYRGYAKQQMVKMKKQFNEKGEYDWKNAMHMIRLLILARRLFLTGEPDLDLTHSRGFLLQIRNGGMSIETVETWAQSYEEALDSAYRSTIVPDLPDEAWAQDFYEYVRRKTFYPNEVS